MEYSYKPTTNGRSVMAACMAMEKPLKTTRVAFGCGKVGSEVNLADVHQLLEYAADGAVAERRHEDDRFNLTIQYANAAHPEVKTFLLSEFIVYVENPETGEDTDLLYGTLGDYRQPVPAYNPAYGPSVFNFPLTLILSDEINVVVAAPAGLVLYDELIRLLNSRAAGAVQKEIVIPTSGWVADADTCGKYAFMLDIASMDITEDMVPQLNIPHQHLDTAANFGLCQSCATLPCALRLYAKTIPTAPITATVALLDTVHQRTGLAGSAATARLDIIIPADGWEEANPAESECALCTDIQNAEIDSCLIPNLAISPEDLSLAAECGMSINARTIPGALRVYAGTKPTAPIHASLALLGVTQSITGNIAGEGGDAFALPIASRTRLGMVKLGDGLTGTPDGTVSVEPDKAPDKAVDDMLEEVYPATGQNKN